MFKKSYLFKMFIILVFVFSLLFFSHVPKTYAAGSGDVVINEIAWMGTSASTSDEWIELYNNTDKDIDVTGCKIETTGGIKTTLSGIIPSKGFYLIERGDDNTISDITADLIISFAIKNDHEKLVLWDNANNLIDEVNFSLGNWPAGDNNTKQTMERIDSNGSGSLASNWHSNDGSSICGLDTNSNPIYGTPKAVNSLPNQPPIAEAGPNQNVILGQAVNFNASSSYDPDGQIISYYWDFGDSEDYDQPNPSHIYSGVGQFTATLEVTDDNGTTSSDQVIINVGWPTYSSNVIINELLPNPSGDESTDEYIEIYNKGSAPIDLSGWKVSDGSGSYYVISKKDFNTTVIPAGGYFVLYRNITGIALNNSGGEEVFLYSPDGGQKSSVGYSESAEKNCSYNKIGDDWQWSTTLTPGGGNVITAISADSTKKVSSVKKAKTTKSTGSKSSGTSTGSVLGIKKAQAAGDSSSHHFSDNEAPQAASTSDRWIIMIWLIMMAAFLGLVIFRFLLWKKDRYKNDTIYH